MDNKILIIDIETSSFLNKGGKILEVGIVELDLDTGKTKIIFDKVCHERPITRQELENAWIVKYSSLHVELIRRSPQFREIKGEIQEIINAYPKGVTAYNNAFDFGFLESRGIKIPKKLPCPMKVATPICALPAKKGKAGYKWPKVEEAWQHFFPEVEYFEEHRGADDALHEAIIVYELYGRGLFIVK